MPTDYFIDVPQRTVFSTGTGVFTQADFLEHMRALKSDPKFDPSFNQLIDGRALTKMDLAADQIKQLATRTIFTPESGRAFVVSSAVHFGMTRMFAAYREIQDQQQVMVFREMPDALRWLGLPPDLKK